MCDANDKASKEPMDLVVEFLSPCAVKTNGPFNYLA